MTTLVIVESPGKIKKIGALLGPRYKVVASVGHVRDLPDRAMGLEPPDFIPHYVPTDRGADVLKRLRQDVAAADAVLLATDPDREGEAISWHLADALKLKAAQRITFTAITKDKVEAAVAAPRPIDMHLVRAQEARRALDRIIGYRVSSALSDQAGFTLTAGRVQSPAVRLVVDREREIASFRVTEHFGAELTFTAPDGAQWKAQWDTKPHLVDGQDYLLDRQLADAAAAVRHLCVTAFEDSEKPRAPAAPFTTSTLQQAAGQRLKLRPKRTMELAQRLYEQGAITYHRTDTPNMDAAGADDIAAFAAGAGLSLAAKKRTWKAKEGAQEGHEAIRPTHAADIEAGETDEEKALYRLIWQRAVASQLADALYAVRTAQLAGDAAGVPAGVPISFKASGRTLINPGWLAVYADHPDDDSSKAGDEDDTSTNPVPQLEIGADVAAEGGRVLTKHTKPPTRFTEATLVKELERQGIGRPSTYAAILDNISTRGYIVAGAKGYLTPHASGEKIRDTLVGRFRFIELDYTRQLEDALDDIATGKARYTPVVASTWAALDGELAALAATPVAPTHPCPACGKALRQRRGKNGVFWSCSGRDQGCTFSADDKAGKPMPRKAPPPVSTEHTCPDCGKGLRRRPSPKERGKFFWGCSGFPDCRQTFRDLAAKPLFPAKR
ncbi:MULTISPECIES: type I DNA topoisomerase [unclassified Novosphingobium]|uniref:type I DNA topoisomerase n=1 Tax=unclassified Novosphingobium TaxID=2644732 RepID=UPI00146ED26D|nr:MULTISPECIES: type I DNA topoisomerase [unclassified Novosphingobium]NMN07563.1 DNA topoisomerase-1 [Novosphingobium sp. SG919]NMN89834.1 DNA topoisomerase-1 [Novosphingobium sp. SG916]